jgi:hypothetical protein
LAGGPIGAVMGVVGGTIAAGLAGAIIVSHS